MGDLRRRFVACPRFFIEAKGFASGGWRLQHWSYPQVAFGILFAGDLGFADFFPNDDSQGLRERRGGPRGPACLGRRKRSWSCWYLWDVGDSGSWSLIVEASMLV